MSSASSLHANCSQKSCLLCAHQTFSVGKRLSIQIECNTFWLNCMRVGLNVKSLDFNWLKLPFQAKVGDWDNWRTEKGNVCIFPVEGKAGSTWDRGNCVPCYIPSWDLICQSLWESNVHKHYRYRRGLNKVLLSQRFLCDSKTFK